MTSGRELVAQAEGKLKGKGGLFGLFGGGPNYADAQDLYQQAANQFKIAKDQGRPSHATQPFRKGGASFCSRDVVCF